MSDDGEWDEKSDLTRIEDLSEFLHEDDPDVDAKLNFGDESSEFSEESTLPDLPIPEEISSLPEDQEDQFDNAETLEESDSFGEESSFENEEFLEDENGDDESTFENTGSFNHEESLSSEESFETADNFENNDSNDLEEGDAFSLAEESTTDEEESVFESPETFESEDLDSTETEEEDTFSGDTFSLEDSTADSLEEESSFESEEEELDNTEEDAYSLSSDEDHNSYEEESSVPEELPSSAQEAQEYQAEPISAHTTPQAVSTTQREDFQDLRDFGNAITYGVVTTGGRPPYSLILRKVKYQEDAEDIRILLREHGLLNDENQATIDQGLEQGSLLISQISEYSAIYLAHKLRRFDLELRIGLSDQLHPSKSYEREGKGLITKDNLKQNKEEFLEIENYALTIEDIKMVTTSQIESYNIHRYIDVITGHSIITEADLYKHTYIDKDIDEDESDIALRNILSQFPQEEEGPIKDLGLNDVYQRLLDDLRNEAYKKEANAVVGVNFAITPMPSGQDTPQIPRYKITCTGNAVWIIDQD